MSDGTTAGSLPPAAWYPDPSGEAQLRYWDGATWTPHVHPLVQQGGPEADAAPVTDAAQAPGAAHANPAGEHPPAGYAPAGYAAAGYAPADYAAGGYAGAVPVRPRGPKVMTGATWAVLATTVVVIAGAVGVAGWGAASAAAEIEGEARRTLDGFVAGAAEGGTAWTTFATPAFAASTPSSPFVGDPAAAESIGLSVEYEVGELGYGEAGIVYQDEPAGADSARAVVDLTYTFTVDGEAQTATVSQAVWLTRPYYYGDDEPSAVREDEQPTSIGPWRVAGLADPDSIDGDAPPPTTTYTAQVEAEGCESSTEVLIDISEIARTEGFIGALCLSGDDTTNIGETIDGAALAASFPVLTDARPIPQDMALWTDYDAPAPLEQYRITAGDTDYIFVFAASGFGGALGENSGRRIISLQIAEEQ